MGKAFEELTTTEQEFILATYGGYSTETFEVADEEFLEVPDGTDEEFLDLEGMHW